MKPLLKKELPNFCMRFGNFIDAQLCTVKVISPTTINFIIKAQDSSRGFDWLTLTLEFNSIVDAKIVDDSKLSLIDMSDGLSIIHEDNSFIFGIINSDTKSGIKNAICYIISSDLKYEESPF